MHKVRLLNSETDPVIQFELRTHTHTYFKNPPALHMALRKGLFR